MDTVLVGVDASEPSRRAVEFAADRAERNGWRVHLVHVVKWSPYSFTTNEQNAERHARTTAEREAARTQVIEPHARIFEAHGVPVDTQVEHGNPSDTLVDLAHTLGVAHIIVGRTGDSGLRAAVFGSVASRLVQHAPCPVTVVP